MGGKAGRVSVGAEDKRLDGSNGQINPAKKRPGEISGACLCAGLWKSNEQRNNHSLKKNNPSESYTRKITEQENCIFGVG